MIVTLNDPIFARELHARALRHTLWVSLLLAGELGFADIEHMLTALLVDVDQRREREDAGA